MNTYSIQSVKTGNTVEATFDDAGNLNTLRFQDGFRDQTAIEWMMRNIPVREPLLHTWMQGIFQITLIPLDIGFEAFWEAYGYKVGKLNAEKEWTKLNNADRAKAIRMIPRYQAWRKTRNPIPDQVYPERYLKQQRFNDQFII